MSAKKHHNSEAIIRKLCQAEILIHEGQFISEICRTLGISDAIYYKWRKEYGGMQMNQARRLKEFEIENENDRLKKAVANLTVDKLILQEVVQGK